jgi:hypothetical protein
MILLIFDVRSRYRVECVSDKFSLLRGTLANTGDRCDDNAETDSAYCTKHKNVINRRKTRDRYGETAVRLGIVEVNTALMNEKLDVLLSYQQMPAGKTLAIDLEIYFDRFFLYRFMAAVERAIERVISFC